MSLCTVWPYRYTQSTWLKVVASVQYILDISQAGFAYSVSIRLYQLPQPLSQHFSFSFHTPLFQCVSPVLPPLRLSLISFFAKWSPHLSPPAQSLLHRCLPQIFILQPPFYATHKPETYTWITLLVECSSVRTPLIYPLLLTCQWVLNLEFMTRGQGVHRNVQIIHLRLFWRHSKAFKICECVCMSYGSQNTVSSVATQSEGGSQDGFKKYHCVCICTTCSQCPWYFRSRHGHFLPPYGQLSTSCDGVSGLLCFKPGWKQTLASTQPTEVLLTSSQHTESAGHTGWKGLTHLMAGQMLFWEFACLCVACLFGGSYQQLTCEPTASVKCIGIVQENWRINDNATAEFPLLGPANANYINRRRGKCPCLSSLLSKEAATSFVRLCNFPLSVFYKCVSLL